MHMALVVRLSGMFNGARFHAISEEKGPKIRLVPVTGYVSPKQATGRTRGFYGLWLRLPVVFVALWFDSRADTD